MNTELLDNPKGFAGGASQAAYETTLALLCSQ